MASNMGKLLATCMSEPGTIKVTGHHYPDVDSLVSMHLMSMILGLFGIASKPVISRSYADRYKTYEELTSYSTRAVMKFLGIPSDKWDIETDPKNILLVDQQPNECYPGPIIGVVDHREPETDVPENWCIKKASSCAYLIFHELCSENAGASINHEVAVATILDTMYLRSSKLIKGEYDELNALVDMKSLTEQLMEIAILPPDLDDAFDNVKRYQIVERGPDLVMGNPKVTKERYYPAFDYMAAYIELNSKDQSVDDVPYSEIVAKMEEYSENILFLLYDYYHDKTMYLIRAKFYGMTDYIVYSETLNGIKPRGTFMKGYIKDTVLPKMARMVLSKSIDETEEFIGLKGMQDSSMAAMMLFSFCSDNGLITNLHTRVMHDAAPENGWNPTRISMVEFNGKYFGLDITGKTKSIIAYDELPEGDEE